MSSDNSAVKENDNLLYSITRKNRNFVVKTWAKQNGQNQILNHAKYSSSDKRLKCGDYGCIYNKGNNKSVLLAYKAEDISQNCNNVDLIVQLNEFNYPNYSIPLEKPSVIPKLSPAIFSAFPRHPSA